MKWEHKLTLKHWGKNFSFLYPSLAYPHNRKGGFSEWLFSLTVIFIMHCLQSSPVQGSCMKLCCTHVTWLWASWSQVKVRERHSPGPSVGTPALLRSWVQAQGKGQTDPYCRTRASHWWKSLCSYSFCNAVDSEDERIHTNIPLWYKVR